ncbi:ATP-binding protein [Yinghuangia seranimata]|uniref:ATP-binding protein n=1 Tax=Yinghuangia seranimata TaxID=408067 RepID=UPI00248C3C7C|nr:ATP-binding protein [Yinghuangia seranimata]MDI2125157.1 ATP-binding protein [Yinghuangia seranimata]
MNVPGRPGSRRAAHRESADARLRRSQEIPAQLYSDGTATPPGRGTHASPGPVLVRWTLPPVVAAVPEVRHRLRDVLRGWRIADELEDTLLLVATELVSNSVRHAALLTERVRVTLALAQGRVRLDVSDDHPFRPRALMDTDEESEDGRGLLIVKLIVAEAQGVIDVLSSDNGKTIRVRVPATPRA